MLEGKEGSVGKAQEFFRERKGWRQRGDMALMQIRKSLMQSMV